MTKTWQDYVQVQQTPTPSTSDPVVRGMSDDEELRRMASWYANGQPTGEMLVDMKEDLRELGIEVE